MSIDDDMAKGIAQDDLDASIAALAREQLRSLGLLRQAATDMALAVETRRQQRREEKIPDLAFSRLGKLVLQICAMEQQAVKLWKGHHEALNKRRTERRKNATRQAVETSVRAATAPGPVQSQRLGQLRDLLPRYDFSDPAKLRATVQDICKALGVPFPEEHFPEDGIEAAARRRVAELRARAAAQAAEEAVPEPEADEGSEDDAADDIADDIEDSAGAADRPRAGFVPHRTGMAPRPIRPNGHGPP